MKTRLDPWCARLLAIVAAAPLLHCGGSTSSDDDGSGGTGASGGTTSSGGSAGKGGSPGTGGTVSSGGSGGTAGKGGTGGSAGTTGTGGSGGFPCENPTPLIPGSDNGYEQCDGDFRHRPEAKACTSLLPREPDWDAIEGDTCGSDADCTEKPHGHCDIIGAPSPNRACQYGCVEDSDCGAGNVCVCGSFIGQCKPASCTTDADCEEGLLCASYLSIICIDGGYACQNPADECMSNADCPTARCALEEDGVRRCSPDGCAQVGRPFLVDEEARLAGSTSRSDWLAKDVALDCQSLSGEERQALGAAWLSNALMEHASVAAFARFTLELLAVGAPADLIRDSNAAASDETRHAELCFALASSYSGEALGPGPLSIDGALDGISLEKLVVTAIAEGCIGETVAAVEAAEQLAHASDPRVREVLSRISEDETRHAELAWRFVAWALEREPSLRGVVEREFARHLSAPRTVSATDELDLTRHGILSGRARSELRSAVLDGVIRDAARALLGSRAPVERRNEMPMAV